MADITCPGRLEAIFTPIYRQSIKCGQHVQSEWALSKSLLLQLGTKQTPNSRQLLALMVSLFQLLLLSIADRTT